MDRSSINFKTMMLELDQRLKYTLKILVLPTWQWGCVGAVTLAGAADTVRADIFHWLPKIPHLPVAWWIIICLFTLLCFVVEASYRNQRETVAETPSVESLRDSFGGGKGGTGGLLEALEGEGSVHVEGGVGGLLKGLPSGGQGGGGKATGKFAYLRMQGGTGGNAPTPDGRGGRATSPSPYLASEPPNFWGAGRGGAGANLPEYDRRVALLAEIRRQYMEALPDTRQYILAGIDTISPDWINARLRSLGETWNVELGPGGYELPPV
jgi:hypothetical protein